MLTLRLLPPTPSNPVTERAALLDGYRPCAQLAATDPTRTFVGDTSGSRHTAVTRITSRGLPTAGTEANTADDARAPVVGTRGDAPTASPGLDPRLRTLVELGRAHRAASMF